MVIAICVVALESKQLVFFTDVADIPQFGPVTRNAIERLKSKYASYSLTTSLASFVPAEGVEYSNRHLLIAKEYEFPSCAFGISAENDLLYTIDRGEPYRPHINKIKIASTVGIVACCIFLISSLLPKNGKRPKIDYAEIGIIDFMPSSGLCRVSPRNIAKSQNLSVEARHNPESLSTA
jgi:hypothetical protein